MELIKKVICQTEEDVHVGEGYKLIEELKRALAEAEDNGEGIYLIAELTLIPPTSKPKTTAL